MEVVSKDYESYESTLLDSPVVLTRGWVKFIGEPTPGLFVSDESAQTADWIGVFSDCEEGQKHDYQLNNGVLPGRLFNGGMCLIATSPFLKQSAYSPQNSAISKKIVGLWRKSDQDSRATHGCTPVQKHLIFFVDKKNKRLHNQPLQLTTQGMYGMQFTNMYKNFCKEMFGNAAVVAKMETIAPTEAKMKTAWNIRMKQGKTSGPYDDLLKYYASTFVFRPVFESSCNTSMKGIKNRLKTCNTKGYKPASLDLLAGMDDGDYKYIRAEAAEGQKAFKLRFAEEEKEMKEEGQPDFKVGRHELDENFDTIQ